MTENHDGTKALIVVYLYLNICCIALYAIVKENTWCEPSSTCQNIFFEEPQKLVHVNVTEIWLE